MHPIYPDKNIKDENLLWSECDPDEEVNFDFGERIFMKELAKNMDLNLQVSLVLIRMQIC